jgi:single-strand DNA-binding protein
VFQQTLIVGRVGRDPELRYTPGGIPVTNFSVAVDRRWTDANGQTQEKVTWFRIVCWRKLAEVTAQYVKKGQRILVAGDIEAAAWTDRDGTPRASLELTAERVRFLGDREADAEGKPPAEIAAEGGKGEGAGDELPF